MSPTLRSSKRFPGWSGRRGSFTNAAGANEASEKQPRDLTGKSSTVEPRPRKGPVKERCRAGNDSNSLAQEISQAGTYETSVTVCEGRRDQSVPASPLQQY